MSYQESPTGYHGAAQVSIAFEIRDHLADCEDFAAWKADRTIGGPDCCLSLILPALDEIRALGFLDGRAAALEDADPNAVGRSSEPFYMRCLR